MAHGSTAAGSSLPERVGVHLKQELGEGIAVPVPEIAGVKV